METVLTILLAPVLTVVAVWYLMPAFARRWTTLTASEAATSPSEAESQAPTEIAPTAVEKSIEGVRAELAALAAELAQHRTEWGQRDAERIDALDRAVSALPQSLKSALEPFDDRMTALSNESAEIQRGFVDALAQSNARTETLIASHITPILPELMPKIAPLSATLSMMQVEFSKQVAAIGAAIGEAIDTLGDHVGRASATLVEMANQIPTLTATVPEIDSVGRSLDECRSRIASLSADTHAIIESLRHQSQHLHTLAGASQSAEKTAPDVVREAAEMAARQAAETAASTASNAVREAAKSITEETVAAIVARQAEAFSELQAAWTAELQSHLRMLAEKSGDLLEHISTIEHSVAQFPTDRLLTQDNRLAIVIDFENYLMTLHKRAWHIDDVAAFVRFLCHPRVRPDHRKHWAVCSRLIYTNESRWKGKEYVRGLNHPQAEEHLEKFKACGFRVVRTRANADVRLAMETVALADSNRVNHVVLVANDGAYLELAEQLVQRGVLVTGVGVGNEMSSVLQRYLEDDLQYACMNIAPGECPFVIDRYRQALPARPMRSSTRSTDSPNGEGAHALDFTRTANLASPVTESASHRAGIPASASDPDSDPDFDLLLSRLHRALKEVDIAQASFADRDHYLAMFLERWRDRPICPLNDVLRELGGNARFRNRLRMMLIKPLVGDALVQLDPDGKTVAPIPPDLDLVAWTRRAHAVWLGQMLYAQSVRALHLTPEQIVRTLFADTSADAAATIVAMALESLPTE